MAECKLRIELDDPEKPCKGGEPVKGTVVVHCDGPVKCSGLEVTSYWSTHGRGNVDKGDIDEAVVFEGSWDAHREYRYPFTLKTAIWPPTYYGTYLNVSHFVRARARLRWANDPKAEAEFHVAGTQAPEDLKPTVSDKKKNSIAGWIIAAIVLLLFLPLLGMLFVVFIPFLVIGAGGYWFFRVYLPRQVTGSIECKIEPLQLRAGESLRGILRFTPRKSLTINGINLNITCSEKCSSGSGSNRQVHTHEIYTSNQRLAEATSLRVGQPELIEFSFVLPEPAPPSLKFFNNEVNWNGAVRIDIPKWPDWVHKFALVVSPKDGVVAPAMKQMSAPDASEEVVLEEIQFSDRLPTPEEQAWFGEVLQQVVQSCEDAERLELVMAAIRDQTFLIHVELTSESDEIPEAQRWERGSWMFGDYVERDVGLCLLWPPAERVPAEGTYRFCGPVHVLGYDAGLDCVMIRVLPPGR